MQTPNMSAFRGKADIGRCTLKCPLMTHSGHCDPVQQERQAVARVVRAFGTPQLAATNYNSSTPGEVQTRRTAWLTSQAKPFSDLSCLKISTGSLFRHFHLQSALPSLLVSRRSPALIR